MDKDYKNFSGVANTRFKGMAKHFGFTEISKTIFAKQHNDLLYVFSIAKSSRGNDFFYISFGISIPYLWKVNKQFNIQDVDGLFFSRRLEDDFKPSFNCRTKKEIEDSAVLAQRLFEEQAIPWFEKFQTLEDAANLFYMRQTVSKERIGTLENACGPEALNYAFFHYHLNNLTESLLWFNEAKRIYSLPIYFETINNTTRVVHERPKGARQYKPDQDTINSLELINKMVKIIT